MAKNTEAINKLQLVKDAQEEIRSLLRVQMENSALKFVQSLFEEEMNRICGPRFSHKIKESKAHRGGSDRGTIKIDGQRMSVTKPRARKNGHEVHLESYSALQGFDLLCEDVMNHMVAGVATRDYDKLTSTLSNGLGLKKSSVSKAFKQDSKQSLDKLQSRHLSNHQFVSVMIDAIHFGSRALICALGITTEGKKLVLGIRLGDTENTDVVKDLLSSLVDRGLDPNRKMLFVLDGGKALKKAVKDVFGEDAPVQRCVHHKLRNVLSYLPKKWHPEFKRKWRNLHGIVDYEEAKKLYNKLHAWLLKINYEAASSLAESEMESLTVIRLQVPQELRKTLSSTNPIESCFSSLRRKTQRVKNWKSGKDQITRWAATGLLEIEKKFRRLKGYKQISQLITNLEMKEKKEFDQNQVCA